MAELQYGVAKSQQKKRNQAALEAFLLPLDIANLTIDIMVVYGEIRADLEEQGSPIEPLGTLIAARPEEPHASAIACPLYSGRPPLFAVPGNEPDSRPALAFPSQRLSTSSRV